MDDVAGLLVIGAAVVRRGRVLAARRTHPPELRGGWELPGGKVEPGETPAAAVVRELREELGCRVRVTGELAGSQEIRPGLRLRVVTAELTEGEPVPREHDALRWLGPEDLGDVRWLRPDVPFLAPLRDLLVAGERLLAAPLRAVFDERRDADAVAARLVSGGFAAEVARERLAGEDDDEDHPWAVLTDAPGVVVELLVERYGGWLEADPGPDPGAVSGPGSGAAAEAAGAPPRDPLELPEGPRRVKGHFRRP